MTKTLAEFNVGLSSVPQASYYLASLEWIRATENLCLVGPAGTGKSHALIALGHAAVAAGMRVRSFAAADLVETLYRGMADNSVAKIIDSLLRADLVICDELGFAPLDLTGSQLLFRFVAAAYERRSLGIASHWPFEAWGRFLPSTPPPPPCWTASCTMRSWSSPRARATGCERPSRREVADRRRAPELRIGRTSTRRRLRRRLYEALRGRFGGSPEVGSLATSGDIEMAIDTVRRIHPRPPRNGQRGPS